VKVISKWLYEIKGWDNMTFKERILEIWFMLKKSDSPEDFLSKLKKIDNAKL